MLRIWDGMMKEDWLGKCCFVMVMAHY
jgi:hypothetical protein